ncbi:hypothetical protein ASPWEDRAFT_439393 [Aspergillus wentii DTO 134E9]|uniref:Uncharacterized protein n=1 Tax=Aspergillus wentii DTO 134E9 TaxID=1073089 RepID=A0A1L9RQF7_ASPWE|nr:uncharacterized protein ASPWEDRAFT_439393 [Aspergillus wentii DTO 134E9]OJJ37103.1 hypothetical protein ASPWEDRAFT_439393 [Aspergillus wentii DTO 134E9]
MEHMLTPLLPCPSPKGFVEIFVWCLQDELICFHPLYTPLCGNDSSALQYFFSLHYLMFISIMPCVTALRCKDDHWNVRGTWKNYRLSVYRVYMLYSVLYHVMPMAVGHAGRGFSASGRHRMACYAWISSVQYILMYVHRYFSATFNNKT